MLIVMACPPITVYLKRSVVQLTYNMLHQQAYSNTDEIAEFAGKGT